MSEKKNSNPRGYFKFALAFDSETTGVATNSLDPTFNPETKEEYQMVSCGLIITDTVSLLPIEELYVEIKWDGVSTWSSKAEQIHGLSKQHLEKHGLDEKDAILKIAKLLLKYFGPEKNIPLIGHNVATFDRYFLDKLFKKHGLHLKFGNRHIDTTAIGFATFGTFNSDDLFYAVGIEDRKSHNALDDARYALTVVRTVRTIWNHILED